MPGFGVHHKFMGALGVIAALSRTGQSRAEEFRDVLLARASALWATLGGTTKNAQNEGLTGACLVRKAVP